MIRGRIPMVDDIKLHRMVRLQLVPLAKKSRPELRIPSKAIFDRLRSGKVFVAANGKHSPFGFISLNVTDTVLWIDMLAVDKEYRKHGWGSALMEVAERHGRQKGCELAKLFVDEHNEPAQNFYKRKGYYLKEYHPSIYCHLLVKDL